MCGEKNEETGSSASLRAEQVEADNTRRSTRELFNTFAYQKNLLFFCVHIMAAFSRESCFMAAAKLVNFIGIALNLRAQTNQIRKCCNS